MIGIRCAICPGLDRDGSMLFSNAEILMGQSFSEPNFQLRFFGGGLKNVLPRCLKIEIDMYKIPLKLFRNDFPIIQNFLMFNFTKETISCFWQTYIKFMMTYKWHLSNNYPSPQKRIRKRKTTRAVTHSKLFNSISSISACTRLKPGIELSNST